MRASKLGSWMLVVGLAALTGCAMDTAADVDPGEARDPVELVTPPRVHIMPVASPGAVHTQAAISAHLTYYGGPVIQNVKVVQVNWGPNVFMASQYPAFYGAIVNSTYFDWLSEYNTTSPVQSIGRGTFAGAVTDSGYPSGTTIDDVQIQTELSRLIAAGSVPASDPNTVYMFHFPPGITITQGGSSSCSQFCAYHGTTTINGHDVYYGVMPDFGGACALGCGTSTQFNNSTSAASHEVVEAVTDPAVGLATTFGPPLAWYDQTNGEIGDICNGQQATVGGYTVQMEWSNAQNACVVSAATSPPPTNDFTLALSPASQTVNAGASTTYTISTAVASGSAGTVTLSVSGLPAGVTGAFSPSSVTAGGSSTLTLTAASSAASSTAPITVTGVEGTVSHTAQASLTVNGVSPPPPPKGELIQNGGFELGLASWTVDAGRVAAVTKVHHTGSYSARVGSTGAYNGDSGVYQSVSIPASGTTTLSFWVLRRCRDTITHDWQEAFVLDANGNILTTLFDTCTTDHGWKNVTASLTQYAGQAVVIYFLDHDDGHSGDPTWMYVDDVSVVNQ